MKRIFGWLGVLFCPRRSWHHQGECITPLLHTYTEREVRLARRLSAQSPLERLLN